MYHFRKKISYWLSKTTVELYYSPGIIWYGDLNTASVNGNGIPRHLIQRFPKTFGLGKDSVNTKWWIKRRHFCLTFHVSFAQQCIFAIYFMEQHLILFRAMITQMCSLWYQNHTINWEGNKKNSKYFHEDLYTFLCIFRLFFIKIFHSVAIKGYLKSLSYNFFSHLSEK